MGVIGRYCEESAGGSGPVIFDPRGGPSDYTRGVKESRELNPPLLIRATAHAQLRGDRARDRYRTRALQPHPYYWLPTKANMSPISRRNASTLSVIARSSSRSLCSSSRSRKVLNSPQVGGIEAVQAREVFSKIVRQIADHGFVPGVPALPIHVIRPVLEPHKTSLEPPEGC